MKYLLTKTFKFLLIFCSAIAFADAEQVVKWFEGKTSIREGDYTLVKEKSDKSCSEKGRISLVSENGFVTMLFDDSTLTFGVGSKVYKTSGLVKGCDTMVTTAESKDGLTITNELKCKSGKGSVAKQKLLKTENGFRIENETKTNGDKWKPGTNCTFAKSQKDSK